MTTELFAAAGAGLAVGLMSAVFGVGGGVLMVPFMVLVLDRGQHLAEGTSLLVIVATATVGTIGHARNGHVAFRSAAFMGAGGMLGAVLGAAIALGTPGVVLRYLFAGLVMFSGVRLVTKTRAERREATTEVPGPPL